MLRVRYLLLLAVIALMKCTTPTSIGTDFIGSDLIEVENIDTTKVSAKTINPGPIDVYQGSSNLSRYLCGTLNDDYFGHSSSQVFGQVRVRDNSRNFEYSSIDSVVLSLRYDSTSFYGNWENESLDIEVYRLEESIDAEADYTSGASFLTSANPIGSRSDFKAEPSTPVIIDFEDKEGNIDTVLIAPQLRVPIDKSIGEEILAYDSLALSDNEVFLESFKGLNLRVLSENTMLAFNLVTPQTRMIVYYRNEMDEPAEMNLSFTDLSAVIPSFEHDFSSGIVDGFIENPNLGDSLLFSQSMAGVETEITLPDLSDWQDFEINHAALSFTVADDLPGNLTNLFPPIRQITAIRVDEDGELRLIRDVAIAESQAGSEQFLREVLGGFIEEEELEDGQVLRHYTLFITQFIDEVRRGQVEPVFRLRPRLKNITAERSILYGPGHSEYPMKLKLVFSTP